MNCRAFIEFHCFIKPISLRLNFRIYLSITDANSYVFIKLLNKSASYLQNRAILQIT